MSGTSETQATWPQACSSTTRPERESELCPAEFPSGGCGLGVSRTLQGHDAGVAKGKHCGDKRRPEASAARGSHSGPSSSSPHHMPPRHARSQRTLP